MRLLRPLLASVFAVALLAAPAEVSAQVKPWKALVPFKSFSDATHRKHPRIQKDGAVEQLAAEIDWLEHHIDSYGTIVAKHPDVWGESRLMRNRHEYEQIMAREKDQFEIRLNAALNRSDQAFLGMALSLSAAATGTPPSGSTSPATAAALLISDPSQPVTTTASTTPGNPNVIARTAPFGLPTNVSTPFQFEPGKDIGLEPTLELDQLSRYLQHLHELRRINEGDDIADSPGYSLNLVRIPISVLPGRHTREGYGAEITVTASPYVTPELLPMTFRTLVINDLVDHLSYPMTRIINTQQPDLLLELKAVADRHYYNSLAPTGDAAVLDEAARPRAGQARQVAHHAPRMRLDASNYSEALNQLSPSDRIEFQKLVRKKIANPRFSIADQVLADQVQIAVDSQRAVAEATAGRVIAISVPASNTRRAQRPLPPSQAVAAFDIELLTQVAADVFAGLIDHPSNRLDSASHDDRLPTLHLMDVRGVLQEELHGAYEFLSTPRNLPLWDMCVPGLAEAIRAQDHAAITRIRNEYLWHVGIDPADRYYSSNTTVALGWCVLVESALLNEQLNRDVQEVSVNKGCGCVQEGVFLPFFGPQPPPEARQAFIDYVNCRWPVQVFALDPVVQDQNVADAYSRRRELQVAASLAFASGKMNAGALMRFTRRLEWDMATIDLNRTVIGFEHGNDTFGWRFQPRFQSPPVVSNLTAFKQSLLGGPTDDEDLRRRQLEPGIRECTAIVVMPSFVPYCTFDTRANWFKLTDPKHTLISNHDSMKLSRAVTAMRDGRILCAQSEHLYRPGEVARLLKRVDQLDRELPLQSMQVQVPFEQTAGGFELFNHGVTDLAPELVGFYGEPGINPNGFTRLFLVGDGFSVHDTRVIAGGREVTDVRLLSRLVMEVTIPPLPNVLNDHGGADRVVDIHVATPYGISSHLLVPIVRNQHLTGTALEFNLVGRPVVHADYKVSKMGEKFVVTVEPLAGPATFAVAVPPFSAMPAEAAFGLRLSSTDAVLVSYDGITAKLNKSQHQYEFATEPATLNAKVLAAIKALLEAKINEDPELRPEPTLYIDLQTKINEQPIGVSGRVELQVHLNRE